MLESIKKDAKRWLKALRASDPYALARFMANHPFPPALPTLRDVQLALARERGFAGWNELKHEYAARPPRDASHARLVDWFLENACPDHHVRGRSAHVRAQATAMRLLHRYPDLAHDSFCTNVVCGNVAEVARVLAARPQAASALCATPDPQREKPAGDDWLKDLGPKGWQPLMYLCSTRLALPAVTDHAVAIATMLLDAGADPNAFFMAGDSKYTPLVATIGEGEEARPPHPRRDELVHLLLNRGAEPFDIQVVYNVHFRGDIMWFLESIYARSVVLGRKADWDDPEWRMLDMGGYGSGAYWHLNIAIRDNNVALAEWCLSHGASPNAAGPKLEGVPPRVLYEEAAARGETEILDLLQRYGAPPTTPTVDSRDAFVAACLRRDGMAARQQLAEHPEYLHDTKALFEATRRNDVTTMRLLFDLGVSPRTEAGDHTTALHIAARAGAFEAAQLLLERGVDVDRVETTWGGTPLGSATYAGEQRVIDLLAGHSRDLWCLAFNGKVDRVRALLHDEPSLLGSSEEGKGLLFALPRDDESRARDLAQLFLAHEVDPSIKDQNGRTAAELAERLAMFELAGMLKRASESQAPS
jgi:ankyrin repeat protein